MSSKEKTRLLKQCINDGHKEYECHSMLKEDSPNYVPIIIPVGR